MLTNLFFEVVIKIEVKDNNRTSAESFKENSKRCFFKIIKLKNTRKAL